MSRFKDFEGKSLDDAIGEACGYYGVAREKLEIEIVSDAKTGIFGLVGVKKARIRAARVQPLERVPAIEEEALSDSPADESQAARNESAGSARRQRESAGDKAERGGRGSGRNGRPAPGNAETASAGRSPARSSDDAPAGAGKEPGQAAKGEPDAAQRGGRGRRNGGRGNTARNEDRKPRRNDGRAPEQPRAADPSAATGEGLAADFALESARDELPEFPLETCDRDELVAVVCGVIQRLVEPIVGQVPCSVEIHDSRVRASVDCGEASGLLVGREGTTLAAVQYLAARIIAKRIGGSLRLQIDAGNYRERQDDRLKEMALSLAERAKATRRPQSTRPLSAYQRRIIHLALEGDDAVQTHSKGEGTQRRVIIQPKRAPRGKEAEAPSRETPEPQNDAPLTAQAENRDGDGEHSVALD